MGMMHLYISHQLMTGDTLPFVRIVPRNAFLQSLLHMQSVVNNYTLHWCVFSKQFSRPRGAAAVMVFQDASEWLQYDLLAVHYYRHQLVVGPKLLIDPAAMVTSVYSVILVLVDTPAVLLHRAVSSIVVSDDLDHLTLGVLYTLEPHNLHPSKPSWSAFNYYLGAP